METVKLLDIPGVNAKADVNVDADLSPHMIWALQVVAAIFAMPPSLRLTVTSTDDGKHSAKSKHYPKNNASGKCEAVDIRTRDIIPAITSHISSALGDDFDCLNEGTHIHIEYDPT